MRTYSSGHVHGNKIIIRVILMKNILCAGIILLLAGCASVSPDQPAGPIVEGWYNQKKTDLQRSRDLDECKTRCRTA